MGGLIKYRTQNYQVIHFPGWGRVSWHRQFLRESLAHRLWTLVWAGGDGERMHGFVEGPLDEALFRRTWKRATYDEAACRLVEGRYALLK
jgi:hypothetical protein